MISSNLKSLVLILLLAAAIGLAYGSPRPKYHGTHILKNLTLPDHIGDWSGEDVKQQVNLGEDQYFFIDDIKTKRYVNTQGSTIFITLLDASNFHHPRACFIGAGYEPKDLPDTTLETGSGEKFTAPTLFFKKTGEDTLVIYWLCINQQRVSWAGQKLKEFWFSLWNKPRTGLTIRLDIPVDEANIKEAILQAQELVKALGRNMPKDQANYIFGK